MQGFFVYSFLMPKYKEYFKKMVDENKEVFDAFTRLQFEYENDPDGKQGKLNEVGEKIQELVLEYENRLCSHSGKGQFSGFTPKLAEKFQEEVRKNFPHYDSIGIIVEAPQSQDVPTSAFSLRKINLN